MKTLLSTPGFVEAFLALVGALFGFILSEWGTARREARNEKKQARASKAVISLEIDMNLELLRNFWEQINRAPIGEKKSQEEQKISLARNFIEAPIPEWSREVFSSQLSSIASALDQQEVVKVFQHYDRLRRLETIRYDLILSYDAQRNELHAAAKKDDSSNFGRFVAVSYLPPTPFNKKAIAVWNECESLVAQLLTKGNPLKSQKAASK